MSGKKVDLSKKFVLKLNPLMVKRLTNVNAGWHMWDNKRNGFNNHNFNLLADESATEDDGNFRVEVIDIVNGKTVFRGEEING